MKYLLCYLETNKWHRHQKNITIAKEINIHTIEFELKESEKAQRHYLAGQVSTIVERVAIIKQKTEDCKKLYRKTLNIFAIETRPNTMDDIIFPYK